MTDQAVIAKPTIKPNNPNFSSGPCSKPPGYDLNLLNTEILGRSHRSPLGKAILAKVIDDTKALLKLPEDYRLGIVPASDTGAVEMALWNLLGARAVDVCYWESFGQTWFKDITGQLQLEVNEFTADYGSLPDLKQTSSDHDVVFTWNGTTSGVCVENADWIADDREGLTICDATSAVFSMELPWEKLDVVTFSWQKALGGEGAHGVIILSPKAVERLESYTPSWPLPKVFRLTKGGKLMEDVFKGATINTPSMLCVVDCQFALDWVASTGGLSATVSRSSTSLKLIEDFVSQRDWISFLAKEPAQRSSTSICLSIALKSTQLKKMLTLLEEEQVAYDIASYRDAPEGIRIWCGATVNPDDVTLLLPWLEWAYQQSVKA